MKPNTRAKMGSRPLGIQVRFLASRILQRPQGYRELLHYPLHLPLLSSTSRWAPLRSLHSACVGAPHAAMFGSENCLSFERINLPDVAGREVASMETWLWSGLIAFGMNGVRPRLYRPSMVRHLSHSAGKSARPFQSLSLQAKAKQVKKVQKKRESMLMKLWSGLLEIGSGSREVSSINRIDWVKGISRLKKNSQEAFCYYWVRTKLLWADMRFQPNLDGGKSFTARLKGFPNISSAFGGKMKEQAYNQKKPLFLKQRQSSSAAGDYGGKIPYEEETERSMGWALKLLLAVTITYVGFNTIPIMGDTLIKHSVALLRTKDPFLKRSGASRISLIATNDSRRRTVVEAGGVVGLVNMLESASDDKTRCKALKALASLSHCDMALEAFHNTGAEGLVHSLATTTSDVDMQNHSSFFLKKLYAWKEDAGH